MAEEADDLTGDIRAAMTELKGDGTPVEAPIAAPVQAEATSTPEEGGSEAPARDEHGRFARKEGTLSLAKPAELVQSVDNQPDAQGPETTTLPPHSLKAAVKANWSNYPPEVREEFVRLEKSFHDGKTEWSSKAERLNRFDTLLSPIKDRLTLQGVDEHTYLGRLMAADQMLNRDAFAGLAHIAQMYGINLGQLGMQPDQAEHPLIARLTEKLSTLEQNIAARDQAAERAELDKSRAELNAFRNDPAHLYFENVRPQMVRLIESGLAETYQDAYDKAIRLDPDVWPLVQKAQSEAASRAAKAQEDARRKINASGSVTGSPTPGGAPVRQSDPNASIADDVRAALAEVNGRI